MVSDRAQAHIQFCQEVEEADWHHSHVKDTATRLLPVSVSGEVCVRFLWEETTFCMPCTITVCTCVWVCTHRWVWVCLYILVKTTYYHKDRNIGQFRSRAAIWLAKCIVISKDVTFLVQNHLTWPRSTDITQALHIHLCYLVDTLLFISFINWAIEH